MKKIITIMLAIMLFCSTTIAETTTPRELTSDEQAYNAYLDIAHVYEYGVLCLEELGRMWKIAQDAPSVDYINDLSIVMCFPVDILTPIITLYLSKYSLDVGAAQSMCYEPLTSSATEKTDIVWSALELEIEAKYLEDPETLKMYLDNALKKIRALMASDKEYPFLSELQAYYKDAVMLYEYIAAFSDNYASFTTKLSNFQKSKSSWEIDFGFIYDPTQYAYVEEVRYAEQQERYKALYERAVYYESVGDYESARDYFWLGKDYDKGNFYDHIDICNEKINAK